MLAALLPLFSLSSAMADTLSSERASEIATAFFARYGNEGVTRGAVCGVKKMWDSSTLFIDTRSAVDSEPTFHVFTNETGRGFVIVAGDDAVRPIIGYSLDGVPANVDEIPDGMVDYLRGVDSYVRTARENGVAKAAASADETGNIVVQLETAEWAQGAPFNKYCFTYYGKQALVGCIPVAFATIMRFHCFPETGTGVIKWATDADGQSSTYDYVITEYDLSTHKYEWEKMPLVYMYGQYTEEQGDAVAQIMADLGKAFNVEYGTSGTGGSHNSYRLSQYFGYEDVGVMQRWQVSDDEWIRLIKESLDASMPIPYAATNAGSGNSKHIFILDGYTDNGFYHFNWGWGGAYNGYFTLDNMTPSAGDNYTGDGTSHQAYFKLRPANSDATSVSDAVSNGVHVYSANGTINVEEYNGVLRIFNCAGTLVTEKTVQGGATISVPTGLYIVVAGNETVKIVVR